MLHDGTVTSSIYRDKTAASRPEIRQRSGSRVRRAAGPKSLAYLRKHRCDYHPQIQMAAYSRRATDHPVLRTSADGR